MDHVGGRNRRKIISQKRLFPVNDFVKRMLPRKRHFINKFAYVQRMSTKISPACEISKFKRNEKKEKNIKNKKNKKFPSY